MSISQQPHSRKLIAFLRVPLAAKMDYIRHLTARLKGALYYRHIFASFGNGSVIYKPMSIGNPRFIHIGSNVSIRYGARLDAVISDPANPPELRIGDNVNIEQNVHIICHSRITIGNDVSITGNCAIVDVTHPYQDVDNPIKIGDPRPLLRRNWRSIVSRLQHHRPAERPRRNLLHHRSPVACYKRYSGLFGGCRQSSESPSLLRPNVGNVGRSILR
jgi:hypothetical protein